MVLFTPQHVKNGRQFLRDARKLLAYKRDLVSDETAAAVEQEIAGFDAVLRTGGKGEIEEQMRHLDEACGKLSKPQPEAGLRENVEVFFVAIVIALAVRTYFLQPFTIPTGSMQPTLNGIIGFPTKEPPPNPLVRIVNFALQGRTYVDVVAKDNEEIIREPEEIKRFFFFTYTRLETSKNNVYLVHAPKATVRDYFLVRPRKEYKAGEPIVRGYVNTGDHVFVDKFTYHFRKPARGEVFVFTTQEIPKLVKPGETSQYYIKRLVGLPGDTLRIDPPRLFVNGTEAQGAAFQRVMRGTHDQPVEGYHGYSNRPEGGLPFTLLGYPDATKTLGPEEYFALGDNSYHSADSRDWGPVPQRNIMGRGVIVYWPFNRTGD